MEFDLKTIWNPIVIHLKFTILMNYIYVFFFFCRQINAINSRNQSAKHIGIFGNSKQFT